MQLFNLFIVFGYLLMINTCIGQTEEIESATPGPENSSDVTTAEELTTSGVSIIDDPTTEAAILSIDIVSNLPPPPTKRDEPSISPETAPDLAVLPLLTELTTPVPEVLDVTTAMPEFRKRLLSIDSTVLEETTVLSAAIKIRTIKQDVSEETTVVETLLEENTSIPTVRLQMLPISSEITETTTAAPENTADTIQSTTTVPDTVLEMIPASVENTDHTTAIPEFGEFATLPSEPSDATTKIPIILSEPSIILRVLGSIPEDIESTTKTAVPVEVLTSAPEEGGGAILPSGGTEENTTQHSEPSEDAIPNTTGGSIGETVEAAKGIPEVTERIRIVTETIPLNGNVEENTTQHSEPSEDAISNTTGGLTGETVEVVTGVPEVREITTNFPEITPLIGNVEENTTQHPGTVAIDIPVDLNSTEAPVVSIGSGQSIPIELPVNLEDIFTDFPTADTDSKPIS